jgi:uncharacterized membrane protein YeaQ/YmgE (transglycosylase-associated protein family)
MEQNYQYSGKVTPQGIVLGLVAGCAAAAVLCIPYAYITIFIPLVFFNVVATIILGMIAGMCAGWGGRKGNMQSAAMYVVVGLIVGLVAEYLNWVLWVFVFSGHEAVVLSPMHLLNIARVVMEEGTWGMTSGDNVAGLELACVWIAEGLMIVGGSIYMARGGLTSYICCPDCTVWFKDPTKTMSYEMPEDLDKVVHDLKGLNLKTLHHLTPLTGQKPASLEFDIFFCPACSTFGCFDL